MKKLIAFSLAAASSLVISNSAMALPQNITIQADGGNAHAASCFLLRNNNGVTGSCLYACEEAGQLPQSPTLSVMFQEQKILGPQGQLFTNCNVNRNQIVPTLLTAVPGSQIFDQFEQAQTVQTCIGQEGGFLACLLDQAGVWVAVSVR